jgi:hypothetical protein
MSSTPSHLPPGAAPGTRYVVDPMRVDIACLALELVHPQPRAPAPPSVSVSLTDEVVDGDELGPFITAYAKLLRLTRTRRGGPWSFRGNEPTRRDAWRHLLGTLVEHYHYIDGAAAKHAAMLLAPGDRRAYLAARRHLADEAEHADLVTEALRRWPEGTRPPHRHPGTSRHRRAAGLADQRGAPLGAGRLLRRR